MQRVIGAARQRFQRLRQCAPFRAAVPAQPPRQGLLARSQQALVEVAKPFGRFQRVMQCRQVGAHGRQPLVHLSAEPQQLLRARAKVLGRIRLAAADGFLRRSGMSGQRPHRGRQPRRQHAAVVAGDGPLQRTVEFAAGGHVRVDVELQQRRLALPHRHHGTRGQAPGRGQHCQRGVGAAVGVGVALAAQRLHDVLGLQRADDFRTDRRGHEGASAPAPARQGCMQVHPDMGDRIARHIALRS
ncbi:hypothetical protein [Cupriavidus necator]